MHSKHIYYNFIMNLWIYDKYVARIRQTQYDTLSAKKYVCTTYIYTWICYNVMLNWHCYFQERVHGWIDLILLWNYVKGVIPAYIPVYPYSMTLVFDFKQIEINLRNLIYCSTFNLKTINSLIVYGMIVVDIFSLYPSFWSIVRHIELH